MTKQWIAETALGKPVVYADRLPGIHLDANILTGGGTDDRAILQAALDRLAAGGGGTLVMPGCSLLSGSLALSSNERLVGLNEGTCGLFLRTGANTTLLTNKHRSHVEGSDHNITVENLTVNGNGQPATNVYNQTHQGTNGKADNAIEFNGVDHVRVSHAQVIDARCYAFCFTSCNRVVAEHLIGYWHCPDHNNDTVHLDAPYNDVEIDDVWGNGMDDEIALNGDECYGFAANPFIDVSGAGSAHIRVSNVISDDASSAVRLISLSGRADDIVIRNVYGTVRTFGILIDSAGRLGFPGNFGSITISGVDLEFAHTWHAFGFPYQQMIGVSDAVENLKLLDTTAVNYMGTYGPWLYLGGRALIGSLTVSGTWRDDDFSLMASGMGRVLVDGGRIRNFMIGPLRWDRPKGEEKGGVLLSIEGGKVDRLTLKDVSTNNGDALVLENGGTIGGIEQVNVRDEDPAGPAVVISGAGN